MRILAIASLASLVLAPLVGCDDSPPATQDGPASDGNGGIKFSFFVTSTGGANGGDLRRQVGDIDGFAGADELCRTKAAAAVPAAANKTWRAYLSAPGINARDRIGNGPWFNRDGVMIASSVANLHDAAANNLTKMTALDERGSFVPGRGDTPNQHDILTGSTADGMAAADHCNSWTSSAATGLRAQVGHHDRIGGGADPTSWNSAHQTNGCSADAFVATGGRGSIYCFAAD
jgi:hypothetical protein